MRRLWLVFSQAVTVAVAMLFVVATLKPEWLGRGATAPELVSIVTAPPVAAVAPAGASAAAAPLSYAAAARRATRRSDASRSRCARNARNR